MRVPITVTFLLCLGLFACSDKVAGQKDVQLQTTLDSVSYGIGTDIGANIINDMQRSGLDSLNLDALAKGIADAMSDTEAPKDERITALVQEYMLEAQKKAMEKQRTEAAVAGEANKAQGAAWLLENSTKEGVQTTPSGLQYRVIKAGTGAKPTTTDRVEVDYKGTLVDGTEFDSSYKKGQPAVFGVTQVIKGWTEGLQLMKEGASYQFFIPSELAYGPSKGPGGSLPPHSTLIFEVVLNKVNP